ncbi:hypothetical protein ACV8AW_000803 [Escherichia coli]
MKQMSLIEMDGFLKGKCIPRDLKVNETNAEYLVRKFAEAEAKCAALAAELSAIEAIHNDAVFITDAHYDQCHPEVQKIIGALAVLQIPAYQDFLAEVRASAIPDEATERDLFEEWVMEKIFISKTTLEGLRTDDGYRNSTLSGTDYNGMWSQWKAIRAAQLRQEAAQ